jgi:hypothetical protein
MLLFFGGRGGCLIVITSRCSYGASAFDANSTKVRNNNSICVFNVVRIELFVDVCERKRTIDG